MQLRFYKDDNGWYADVPGRTQEENEMVAGSDKLLEMLASKLNRSEVTLELVPHKHPNYLICCLRQQHDEYGATYKTYSDIEEFNNLDIWICNVTHDVFEEHPKDICIIDIK